MAQQTSMFYSYNCSPNHMLMKHFICLETCLSSRFMSIVLWPGMTHLMPVLSQNACCGWGAWCHSLSFETFNSVAQSCLTLCDPMNRSMPGLPVHHQLLEFTQTHVHSGWSSWCHPTILSSVVPFFSCLQSFPASGSFPMSQLLASGGQSIGISASASVLPMNIQDWFPSGLIG